MAKHDDKPNDPRALRRQVREVADSLAIAFILAMVIRHYVLEVFKIPTKSMEPTLLGDPWSGDKILVNKFAYDFRDPRRWEIAVFKYPVDTTKNYIKRVVGLPGENVRVRYGDLYINGAIARKPWRVQKDLWRLCPHSGEARSWRGTDGWTLADNDFTANCGGNSADAELVYEREITAYDAESTTLRSGRSLPYIPTSDIMVEFLLVPRRAAGALSVGLDILSPSTYNGSPRKLMDQWEVTFALDAAPCVPEVRRSGRLFAVGAPCRFTLERPTLVQVCNVDRSLLVRVGDTEVVRKEYEPTADVFEWGAFTTEARIQLACAGAELTLRNPAVYVDVYYTDNPHSFAVRAPYQLGADEYFVLGDNSVNSNDSRAWEKVPRSYLVGEAFLVLWPLGRMKLVR
ncbi:MAG TPA: signal peptidase I [Planctomycetota bacterium]|nr:signal peptidase I [Planctomycetota bacterium]HRR79344.1 signal peptidase I [Planctomycetota bacterium]HRT96185.1 signal peptidase I [Planctomycetota bacterium]